MKKISFIEVESEVGAGTRGSSFGSKALQIEAIENNSKVFDKKQIQQLNFPNQFENFTERRSVNNHAKDIKKIINVYEQICDKLTSTLTNQNFPFVLAADHSNAGGTIAGIKKQFPNKKLGVIWIDAHADLHTPFTTPSGNLHGMPLAVALGFDKEAGLSKFNDIDEDVKNDWNSLKNVGLAKPKINTEDLVFIALRDFEEAEKNIIEKNNVKVITVEELREKTIEVIAAEVNKYLDKCDIIYISFDVDSMDCDLVSYGTGTPVPNGITAEEAKEIIEKLIQPNLVAFEITEINPVLDKENKMAKAVLPILENTVKVIERVVL